MKVLRLSARYAVWSWLFVLATCLALPADSAVDNDVQHNEATIQLTRSFWNPWPVHRLGFCKDGQTLACSCSPISFPDIGNIDLWDTITGKGIRLIRPVREWKGSVLRPGGPIEFQYFFTTVPFARLCFRVPTGLEVQDDLLQPTKRLIPLKGLEGGARIEGGSIYFSMDDSCVAAVLRDDHSVQVWNTQTGDRLWRFPLGPDIQPAVVRSMAFDPTNHRIAVGVDFLETGGVGATIVWNLENGREELCAKEGYRVFQVVFTSEGQIVSGCLRNSPKGLQEEGALVIRKVEALSEGRTIPTPLGIAAIASLSDDLMIAGDFGGRVSLWNIHTGEQLNVGNVAGRAVVALALSPNRNQFVSGDWDSKARLWTLRQ